MIWAAITKQWLLDKFVSHSSGCWESKTGMSAWMGEGPLPGCRLLTVYSCVRRGALWGLLYKGTNPIHKGSTLMIYSHLPKATPTITINSVGLDFNVRIWEDPFRPWHYDLFLLLVFSHAVLAPHLSGYVRII